jgi:hypothetical protein
MTTAMDPKDSNYIITTTEDELKEGLFGQIVLFIFEILPYLYSKGIFPGWDIKSKFYGIAPDYKVVPGAFDLAYIPENNPSDKMPLKKLRAKHVSVLGNDWHYMHKLWNAYFKIPDSVINKADSIGDLSNSLGIHYRGTDKNLTDIDTNSVTHEEFILLVKDFIRTHPGVSSIFIATDEYEFVKKAELAFPAYKIINAGEVTFHLNKAESTEKADRAVFDCLLLSRCKYLIKSSSALSGFAKVLNADLECYRVAASKFFADIPYFPDAYIDRLTSNDPECSIILERLFKDDWLQNKRAAKFHQITFTTQKRYKYPLFIRKPVDLVKKYKKLLVMKVKTSRRFKLRSFIA